MNRWKGILLVSLAVFGTGATQEMANAQQLIPQGQVGIIVTGVVEGTPAWWAGLEPGDVIVSCNGIPIRNGRDLAFALSRMPLSQLEVIDTRTGRLIPLAIARTRDNTIGIFYRSHGR